MKASTKDSWELVYLRHNYFRKTGNVDQKRLLNFEELIVNKSAKLFYKNRSVFFSSGMEVEDIENIMRCHALSFLAMGGLKENPDKMQDFVVRHKKIYGSESELTKEDIFKKECYDMSKFLDQRCSEMYKFCVMKNKNINGLKETKKHYIGPRNIFPKDSLLLENHKKYGYKKITQVDYSDMVKKYDPKDKNFFAIDENTVVRTVSKIANSFQDKDNVFLHELSVCSVEEELLAITSVSERKMIKK